MSGWCGSCGPGGSALATAGLKTIAAAEAIPTTRRHITLMFIGFLTRPFETGRAAAYRRWAAWAGAAVTTVAGAAISAVAIVALATAENLATTSMVSALQNHQQLPYLSTIRRTALHQLVRQAISARRR